MLCWGLVSQHVPLVSTLILVNLLLYVWYVKLHVLPVLLEQTVYHVMQTLSTMAVTVLQIAQLMSLFLIQ